MTGDEEKRRLDGAAMGAEDKKKGRNRSISWERGLPPCGALGDRLMSR